MLLEAGLRSVQGSAEFRVDTIRSVGNSSRNIELVSNSLNNFNDVPPFRRSFRHRIVVHIGPVRALRLNLDYEGFAILYARLSRSRERPNTIIFQSFPKSFLP